MEQEARVSIWNRRLGSPYREQESRGLHREQEARGLHMEQEDRVSI